MSGINCKKAKNNLDVTRKGFALVNFDTAYQQSPECPKMNWFPSERDKRYFAKALTQHL